ncbi:MAG: hypothetical protein V3V13_00135 [Paracoccaceae bacterium]
MRKLARQQSGNLGEVLALARINSLDLAAYSSPDGAPGHDLIVIVGGVPQSIEVKTRQYIERPTEITRWPVDWVTKGDANFFLFIELNLRSLTPTFYLLNNAQALETYRDYKGGGNCTPSRVRKAVAANDFSPLLPELT